jgi:hypothetical protein
MTVPNDPVELAQLHALGFMLDRVFAPPVLAPTHEQLAQALAAARAENRVLRARIDALERERYPGEADLDTYELDRLLRDREADEEI